jgi:hypothetical protein
MKVYLSGPISGSLEGAIVGWRQRVVELLPQDVDLIDPAASPYDASSAYLVPETDSEKLGRLMHGRLVIDRNKHLIQSSDVVLANFLYAERASIGSIGELFWANAFRVPIVVVRETVGNVHDHAMLNAVASVVTHSLEDGCAAIMNMMRTEVRLRAKPYDQTASSRASADAS